MTTKDSTNKWRQLLSGGGVRTLSVSGSGVFTDETSEETMRGYAFAGSVDNYELIFGNADTLSGAFQISSYERSGDHNGEETYSMTLDNAGDVTFATA